MTTMAPSILRCVQILVSRDSPPPRGLVHLELGQSATGSYRWCWKIRQLHYHLRSPDSPDSPGSPKFTGLCDHCDTHPGCSSFSSSLAKSVSFSVAAAMSSTVASLNSTLLDLSSSASSTVKSASDAGFREGQKKASASAQSAIDAARIGASPTSGVLKDESQDRGLNINAGQLAGIVAGIFISSCFLSVLATVLLLRYRRQKLPTTKSKYNRRRKSAWLRPRPALSHFWTDIYTSKHTVTEKAFHRQSPEQASPTLEHEVAAQQPSEHRRAMPSVDVTRFSSLSSTDSPSEQPFPVSPLSDDSGRDFLTDKETSPGFSQQDAPINASHHGNGSRHPPQQVRKAKAEIEAQQPSLGVWMGQNSGTDKYSGNSAQTTAALPPKVTHSGPRFSPIVPVRFSSLTANNESRALSPMTGSTRHGERGGEEHLSSSVRQPTSRFSMSPTATHSSAGYSPCLSSSPPSSHNLFQHEPEPLINPLRPAPPAVAPQLRSPLPHRPNFSVAADVPSFGPNLSKTSWGRGGYQA
ncbi:hypothetical protein F5Y17DRAFT_108841 [Xylariaceae sp. FL0594]|nr:hypothetical protein F5Y17DRAFT_108841 [Xylariaceae sp. FL0594]